MAEILIPSGSGTGKYLVSGKGEYTVPMLSSVGDLVYVTGSKTVGLASNASETTAPVRGVILEKQAATVATLLFSGVVAAYAGLIPNEEVFLGVDGSIVYAAGLPTSPGRVIQLIGTVVDVSTILFFPNQLVVL